MRRFIVWILSFLPLSHICFIIFIAFHRLFLLPCCSCEIIVSFSCFTFFAVSIFIIYLFWFIFILFSLESCFPSIFLHLPRLSCFSFSFSFLFISFRYYIPFVALLLFFFFLYPVVLFFQHFSLFLFINVPSLFLILFSHFSSLFPRIITFIGLFIRVYIFFYYYQ